MGRGKVLALPIIFPFRIKRKDVKQTWQKKCCHQINLDVEKMESVNVMFYVCA